MTHAPVPVVLDTDIGSDIDDTWALSMLLRCPEVDLRLVTSATSQPQLRAQLAARILDVAGRADVPVGVGLDWVNQPIRHGDWVKDYPITKYPGQVHPDGIQAIVRTIMSSERPVTLLSIGPLPNIAAALEREPDIATRAHFVGMHGSVFRGYGGAPEAHKEWNVVADIKAAQRVFAAPRRSITITPLDTCGLVQLKGAKYEAIRDSRDVLARMVIENYDMWRQGGSDQGASSALFDTVAVYLTFTRQLLSMQPMGIRVTDEGLTVPDEHGARMDVAVAWRDLGAFEDLLVQRLTNGA